MSGGGQVAGQGANPNLPQQSGMRGLPAVPQVQASTGPYQGAAVQQQIANQAGAAPQSGTAAFQQMLGTMQNTPQMTAYHGGAGVLTPQMNPAQLSALAAQIQNQFAQQVGSQQPASQAQPAAVAPAATQAAPAPVASPTAAQQMLAPYMNAPPNTPGAWNTFTPQQQSAMQAYAQLTPLQLMQDSLQGGGAGLPPVAPQWGQTPNSGGGQ